MSVKASASQNKSILWLDEKQRLGLNVPSDSGPAHAVSAEIARELAAGNIAAVAERPCDFFLCLEETGYPGKGAFSDTLIDNTLAVVNRLSEQMHSALYEHDGRNRRSRDALVLAKNWLASYGPLCRWASWAWVWRRADASIIENPPHCDWDASGDIRSHNIRVGVFGPINDAHEKASALLASTAGDTKQASVSMACAWLRDENQSLDNAQPPCDAGKEVHEGLVFLRRLVFGASEMLTNLQLANREGMINNQRAAKKRRLTPAQKAKRRRGGQQRSVIEDEDAIKILTENKRRGKTNSVRGRANDLVAWCRSKGIVRKDGCALSLRNIQELLTNTKKHARLSKC